MDWVSDLHDKAEKAGALNEWYDARGRATLDFFPEEDEFIAACSPGRVRALCELAEAAERVKTCCREPDCAERAEFILWGKLFKSEALGPRCYDHAAKHAGHWALGDPAWAILDLRPMLAALASLETAREEAKDG